jgi:hypothetical protein
MALDVDPRDVEETIYEKLMFFRERVNPLFAAIVLGALMIWIVIYWATNNANHVVNKYSDEKTTFQDALKGTNTGADVPPPETTPAP